jgi:hypothetical protein
MPATEDGRTPLEKVLALIPTKVRASWARFMATERRRQASYDAMGLPQLNELATASVRTAANTLSNTTLTSSLRE